MIRGSYGGLIMDLPAFVTGDVPLLGPDMPGYSADYRARTALELCTVPKQ